MHNFWAVFRPLDVCYGHTLRTMHVSLRGPVFISFRFVCFVSYPHCKAIPHDGYDLIKVMY